jgi:uncharacterized protein (DUF2141 family)
MRPTFSILALLISIGILPFWPSRVRMRQFKDDRFELRGTVINAVTGQAVSHAAVQIQELRSAQFSGPDGSFSFEDLPRGQFTVQARKPGFFNEQELSSDSTPMDSSLQTVPADRDVVLKLTPEGVIYGEVKNENGEPLERVGVSAKHWQMDNGHRRLQAVAYAGTDDLGAFRIAELRPGNYYLSFQQQNVGAITLRKSASGKTENHEGYGLQFYPGGTDSASASVIEIRPGTQIHILQTMSRQRLYVVGGVVRGADPERGFNLTLMDASGDSARSIARSDAKSGSFQFQPIPPGYYLLRAFTSHQKTRGPESDPGPRLSVTVPIHVNSDIYGLVLTLAPEISVQVQVRDETSDSRNSSSDRHIFIRMISAQFTEFSDGSAMAQWVGTKTSEKLESVSPGTYTVIASTESGPRYVAQLRCGNVDLLRDDLVIAPGSAPPPMVLTLRDDSAQLHGSVTERGRPVAAAVVAYSPDYPKQSVLIRSSYDGAFSEDNLPPGNYQVIALKNAQEVEFQDPAAMEKYLAQASTVSLGPRQKATLQLELRSLDEDQ